MLSSVLPPPSMSTIKRLTARSAPSTRRKLLKQERMEKRIFRSLLFTLLCLVSFSVYNWPTQNKLKEVSTLRGVIHKGSHLSNLKKFNEDSIINKSDMNHLIMVAGHSVLLNGNAEKAGTDERLWYLLDYQKGKGLPQTILLHIKAGIAEAAKDPQSLLVFSGGQTRVITGPADEGGSYYRVADALNLWGGTDVRKRTVTEEFATDSFQNLLYSMCRFKEVTSSYPTKVTVISFSFKRQRFEGLHAPAIHIPAPSFHYIGVDPPASTGFDYLSAADGEANTVKQFETDPYGCYTEALKEKRKGRNPFLRTPWYDLTCPDMEKLMHWCGPDMFPKNEIQWIL